MLRLFNSRNTENFYGPKFYSRSKETNDYLRKLDLKLLPNIMRKHLFNRSIKHIKEITVIFYKKKGKDCLQKSN